MKKNLMLLLFLAILVVLVVFTFLAYLMMADVDKIKFPFEIGKFLMQLIVMIIIGGAVQLIYSVFKIQQEGKASENYYTLQFDKAKKLLYSGKTQKIEKAVYMLTRLSNDFKYRRQDVISEICNYLRETCPQKEEFDITKVKLVEFILKSLAQIPRRDENNHTLCIDINRIKIEGINLFGINLSEFILWGCQFKNVIFSKGSFENADLSGVVFDSCGMEFCNFKNALIARSPLDSRDTTFINTLLFDNNLHESRLICCNMHKMNESDITPLYEYIQSGKIRMI